MDVLIVDDEAPIRMLLKQILVNQGFNCQEARDAAEASL